jgi:alpha-tubulin suppressor-like RCC1 family protein
MRTPPWVFQSWRLAGGAALTLGLAAAAVAGPGGTASAAIKPPCCRILTQSAAVGWGSNDSEELGNRYVYGDAVNWIPVIGLTGGVVQVSAGTRGSLALTSDGRVWAWGSDDNAIPATVPGLSGITQVASGVDMSLALRSDGTVWAWGSNDFGELGDGNYFPSSTPVQVTKLTGVTQIATGQDSGLALRSDGTVWSWGFNGDGQLGDDSTSDSAIPVQVMGLSHVTRIAAGHLEGMAVATRGLSILNPTVYAWGDNSDGQIGDGSYQNRLVPVPVSGLSMPSVAGIAVGGDFAMALGADGTVWDWGGNGESQLGDGTTAPTARPVEARGLGSGIVQVTAGQEFAIVRHSDGTVWGWGWDGDGELGDGTDGGLQFTRPAPVQVASLNGATQVSAGPTFVLAIHQAPVISLPS